jgi:hypothetical protein
MVFETCFVSSLDNLRLYANLFGVWVRTQRCGRQQEHRGMRRNGGLGRSAAAESGAPPTLRGPQDGTQIERVFSRKKAQNAQKGNPFLSLLSLFAAIRNPQSAIRNAARLMTRSQNYCIL